MADAFEQEIYQRTFVEAEEPSINGTATPGSQGQGTAKQQSTQGHTSSSYS